MSGEQIGTAFYLVLLGCALVLWFFAQNRASKGKVLQQALVWVLIFVGAIAAVGLWGDIRREVMPQQSFIEGSGEITLPRAPDGHFYAALDVNGQAIRFVVDTGATNVVLNQRDAARVGLDPEALAYVNAANTANGIVRTARVTLDDVLFGDIPDQNVTAYVNQGEMSQSLLGMSYLQRFETIQITGDELRLIR
ncbi:TIGR02281 family clan AA aspartic protease [Pseudoruegeria sp. SHC-113]|uniref:retropepsin-like aspartic protease family protein n=1 Tax=Pseudoruegeria sp. SHC-113 TaxID=2855439 RepID=UPI0021BBA880|nr:TIGR02281 family clan AA aspartic protease [Pseudoruegeria sp. SHC-113]MCT8159848.1 TIGR02281 family clan AA aspartic protease [Pseudoruegeria sp. SHC-113]